MINIIMLGSCTGLGVTILIWAMFSVKLPLATALDKYEAYRNIDLHDQLSLDRNMEGRSYLYNNRLTHTLANSILESKYSVIGKIRTDIAAANIRIEKFVMSVIIAITTTVSTSIICFILLRILFPADLGNDWLLLEIFALIFIFLSGLMPVQELRTRARNHRKHFLRILAVFVELVALGQAGGMGIEGALEAAGSLSDDWAFQAIRNALTEARASGKPPWSGLEHLSIKIAVPQLRDFTNSLMLAGSEGAKVRQSLRVKANSLRRHQLANLESEANMITEKLFLPSILLMTGFMLFISYPAIEKVFQVI